MAQGFPCRARTPLYFRARHSWVLSSSLGVLHCGVRNARGSKQEVHSRDLREVRPGHTWRKLQESLCELIALASLTERGKAKRIQSGTPEVYHHPIRGVMMRAEDRQTPFWNAWSFLRHGVLKIWLSIPDPEMQIPIPLFIIFSNYSTVLEVHPLETVCSLRHKSGLPLLCWGARWWPKPIICDSAPFQIPPVGGIKISEPALLLSS